MPSFDIVSKVDAQALGQRSKRDNKGAHSTAWILKDRML
jgi:hypothetical protein